MEENERKIGWSEEEAILLKEYEKLNPSLIDAYVGEQISKRTEVPPVIYHYTNLEDAYKIIESNTLWLSSSSGKNDKDEEKTGLDYIEDAIKYYRTRTREPYRDPKTFLGFGLIFRGERDKTAKIEHYSFSFCRNGDDGALWHRYADDGRGIAIGFRSELLKFPELLNPNVKTVLTPVLYEASVIEDIIHATADFVAKDFEKLRKLGKFNFDLLVSRSSEEFLRSLMPLLLVAKNKTWMFEEEVRLCFYDYSLEKATYTKDIKGEKRNIVEWKPLAESAWLPIVNIVFGKKLTSRETEAMKKFCREKELEPRFSLSEYHPR